jgi:hypothetical protein
MHSYISNIDNILSNKRQKNRISNFEYIFIGSQNTNLYGFVMKKNSKCEFKFSILLNFFGC